VRGLTGVVTTDFGAWRLQPTLAPTFEARNLRPADAPRETSRTFAR
jgi:hypothetical protein